MPELTSFIKDPQAVLDYAHDYTAWLNGDTLATHAVIMPAANISPVSCRCTMSLNGDPVPTTTNRSSSPPVTGAYPFVPDCSKVDRPAVLEGREVLLGQELARPEVAFRPDITFHPLDIEIKLLRCSIEDLSPFCDDLRSDAIPAYRCDPVHAGTSFRDRA